MAKGFWGTLWGAFRRTGALNAAKVPIFLPTIPEGTARVAFRKRGSRRRSGGNILDLSDLLGFEVGEVGLLEGGGCDEVRRLWRLGRVSTDLAWRQTLTLDIVKVTVAPLPGDDGAVPGHAGGAPLGPVG